MEFQLLKTINVKIHNWIIIPCSELLYRFGIAIGWSSLSSIGNSRLAQLTIVMPFVGYLIVFNISIADFITTIIPEALSQQADDFWTSLYSRKLYFLYFGLLLFGSGVALFNIAAPSQIRRFPVVERYIAAMNGIKTPNLVIGSFENIIGRYFANLRGEEQSPMFEAKRIAFPDDLNSELHRFIEQIFLATEFSDEEYAPAEDRLGSCFWTGSGYLMTDKVLDVAYSGRRVERVLQTALLEEAVKRPTDVFYLEHRALDHCRASLRMLVFILYALGSTLLIFPSILTSIIVLKYW